MFNLLLTTLLKIEVPYEICLVWVAFKKTNQIFS